MWLVFPQISTSTDLIIKNRKPQLQNQKQITKKDHQVTLPNRNFQLIGDWGNIQSKLSFLVETNKIDLCQVWNLKQRCNLNDSTIFYANKETNEIKIKLIKLNHCFKNKINTFLQAEIGWWTIGCPAKGKRGFGIFNDNGLNLVPATFHIPTQLNWMKKNQRN
jgi:hypothetical protein